MLHNHFATEKIYIFESPILPWLSCPRWVCVNFDCTWRELYAMALSNFSITWQVRCLASKTSHSIKCNFRWIFEVWMCQMLLGFAPLMVFPHKKNTSKSVLFVTTNLSKVDFIDPCRIWHKNIAYENEKYIVNCYGGYKQHQFCFFFWMECLS